MGQFTNNPKLSNIKITNETVEVARYGRGKVLGEAIYVIPELKFYQPYSLKCISHHGELLRISSHEFEKKILTFPRVLEMMRFNATSNLILNYEKLNIRT